MNLLPLLFVCSSCLRSSLTCCRRPLLLIAAKLTNTDRTTATHKRVGSCLFKELTNHDRAHLLFVYSTPPENLLLLIFVYSASYAVQSKEVMFGIVRPYSPNITSRLVQQTVCYKQKEKEQKHENINYLQQTIL